jgi:hypothetical protein
MKASLLPPYRKVYYKKRQKQKITGSSQVIPRFTSQQVGEQAKFLHFSKTGDTFYGTVADLILRR